MTVKLGETPVQYHLDLSQARTHQIGVTMDVQAAPDGPLDLVMPALSPGSPTNSLNQAARISKLDVQDAGGHPLTLEKTGAGNWTVADHAKGPFKVTYTVKSDEFSHVRSFLSEELAYVDGPSALMFVRGMEQEPSTIELDNLPNPAWTSSSQLPTVAGQSHEFYAANFDEIADSNILAGQYESASARLGDVQLTVNQNGIPPWAGCKTNGTTPEQSLADLTSLYKTFLKQFGNFPLERYASIGPRPEGVQANDKYVVTKHYIHTSSVGAGGYEHYHGHEIMLQKSARGAIDARYDGDGRAYERGIMAHELMHKLLAKLVRHEGIDSADLSTVGSTDGLWLTEGGVEWAGMQLQRLADVAGPELYLRGLQDQFSRYQIDYAQDPTSPRDNSFDAHLGNGKYYNKGAVACSMLDLEIRAVSHGQKNFFDVLRGLKDEFGGNGKFWTLDDLQRITDQTVGADGSKAIGAFFDRHLRHNEAFDFEATLAPVGYQLSARQDAWLPGQLNLSAGATLATDGQGQVQLLGEQKNSPTPDGQSVNLPGFGLGLARGSDGKFKIGSVSPDGPSFKAGLGDFAGASAERVTAEVAGQAVELGGSTATGPVQALTFEFKQTDMFSGAVQTHAIRVESAPATRYVLESVPTPTPEQLALRERWLGAAKPD